MTMFSFGLIKYNTAFYGAVTIIKQNNETHRKPDDKPLYQMIEALQDTYKLYSPAEYGKKLSTARKLSFVIQNTWVVYALTKSLWAIGRDPEQEQLKMLRGFPATNEPFLNKFHVKPSAALIRMLIDRTKHYSHKDHLAKTEPSNRMSVALSTNGIFVPGYAVVDRSYWLLPIAMPNRELFKAFCEKQGVFCVYRTT